MEIPGWMRAVGRLVRGRYVRLLEEENARLRAENLALLNSLLGTAGVPPLRIDANGTRAGLKPGATQGEARSEAGGDLGSNAAVRKRSWQQIGRMLEIEEARREREHAARVAEIRERWTAEGNGSEADSPKR